MRSTWRAVATCLALAGTSTPALPGTPQQAEQKGPRTDADMETLAREAMASKDESLRREALKRLGKHVFRGSKAPQKEYCLFAQGMLQAAFGDVLEGAATLKKLERGWPQSPLLVEAQLVLAQEAQQHKRYKEAETRLRKAIDSDLPPAQRRRAQDLMLWMLAEQGRPQEGLGIVETLHPLIGEEPTERGLAALAMVQCSADDRTAADRAVKSYFKKFPKGALWAKVQLAWGRHLGALGDGRGSAEALRKLLREQPKTPEADEARLALAMLLSEGKVPARIAKAFPDPAQLLKEMGKVDPSGDVARERTAVRLRLALKESRWREAMDHADALKNTAAPPGDAARIASLRADAFRAYTRECLDKKTPGALLPYLDPEHLETLSPDSRLNLGAALARAGLPEAALHLKSLSPATEQGALAKALAEATIPEAHPESTLQLLPRNADAMQALRGAQAQAARKDWAALAKLLPRAKPGPERVQLVLTLLRRPVGKDEKAAARLREAESWLARAAERGPDREPLTVLVADLRAQQNDWRGALALYPDKPQPALKGWVALQRATAMIKLGRKAEAKALLQANVDEAAFKMERQTLGKDVGL